VGHDVADEIARSSPAGDSAVDRSRPRPHVDLRRVIEAQLQELGVDEVDHVRGCTMCDRERFHSYRRDGATSGRMIAIVAAP
jgi:copper oxidase (laccase) domain-containing protein